MRSLCLLPYPRKLKRGRGVHELSSEKEIVCTGESSVLMPIARRLARDAGDSAGGRWKWRFADSGSSTGRGAVELRLREGMAIPAQGYTLQISPRSIVIEAGDGVEGIANNIVDLSGRNCHR